MSTTWFSMWENRCRHLWVDEPLPKVAKCGQIGTGPIHGKRDDHCRARTGDRTYDHGVREMKGHALQQTRHQKISRLPLELQTSAEHRFRLDLLELAMFPKTTIGRYEHKTINGCDFTKTKNKNIGMAWLSQASSCSKQNPGIYSAQHRHRFHVKLLMHVVSWFRNLGPFKKQSKFELFSS